MRKLGITIGVIGFLLIHPSFGTLQSGEELTPITVSSKNGGSEEGLYPIEKGVRTLQLLMDFDKVTPTKLGLKSGARFQIVGTLSHRNMIHHVSRVLVWVQSGNSIK